jgi:hypothetical protein
LISSQTADPSGLKYPSIQSHIGVFGAIGVQIEETPHGLALHGLMAERINQRESKDLTNSKRR